MYIWTKLAADGERLELLKSLKKLDVGLNEEEDRLTDLTQKFRSMEMRNKGNKSECVRGVVREPMRLKLMDARKTLQETISQMNQKRRELKLKLGDNSWKYRSVMKQLRGEQEIEREVCRKKNREKVDNLWKKHEDNKETELDFVPTDLEEYGNLTVFD